MKRWQEKVKPPARIRKDARKNLIAQFNKLAIRNDLRPWIELEVRWLLVSAHIMVLSSRLPPPEFKEWDAETVGCLKQFGELARRLGECLHSMPPAARAALFNKGPTELGYAVIGLDTTFYKTLAAAADQASKRPPPGGRPVRWTTLVAEDFTKRTADAYELLTGKRAGPGSDRNSDERNEFENLLTKVFANLGIDASAEVQAKKLRTREKTRERS